MKRMKMKVAVALTVLMSLFMRMTVMASTVDVADVMASGMNSVVSEILSILAVILPIGLGLVGTFIAIRAGINLIRRLTRG